jgi:LmbE family N-acetylglucosaminyl deacetylase
VAAAAFYSGLRKRGRGRPHRPARVLSYMLHDAFAARVIVDVSEVWEIKRRALEAHRSQFHLPGPPPSEEGPDTLVSSARFWDAIEGRARHYGMQVGCELGEALWSPGPLPLSDPFAVVGGGLR